MCAYKLAKFTGKETREELDCNREITDLYIKRVNEDMYQIKIKDCKIFKPAHGLEDLIF